MISVLEGTMTLYSGFVTIALASFMIPIVLIIFRYAMREKSYEERVAEQRKQLMEHNVKSKSKHQPAKKSSKKVEKERSHSDTKKKPVFYQNVHSKDTKKSETLKSNTASSTTERMDGIIANSKKRTEKIHSKNSNSNLSLKSTSDDGDDKTRTPNDDNNNQEKFTSDDCEITDNSGHDDPNTSSASTSSSFENDASNSSFGCQLENGGIDSECYAGHVTESEVVLSEDLLSITTSETSNESDKKPSSSEVSEKLFKKHNSKLENETLSSKSSQKSDEKTRNSKPSKQKSDEKEKSESEKYSKEYGKLSASPAKNKKSSENITSKNSEAGSDTGSHIGNTSDEAKNIQDIKKEVEINIIVAEPVVEKEEVNPKLEKSHSPVNNKKINSSAPGINGGGKTSPVQGAKSSRQTNNVKNIKKQSTEMKALQKITNENNGPVNVTLLIPLLAKAELSRSEIQNLIDLLLNKQQDSTIDAEWIGSGRQDPMVKLKKQLGEKEKALIAEQEAHQALQSKVKELRAELNNEKHINRQREETTNSLKADFQALNARFQAASEEKQNYVKQLQQVQSKLSEERMITRSLKEEHAKTKSNLQQELLSQRQQLEIHISHLTEQNAQTLIQLNQVLPRLQEQENANGQISEELVLARERNSVLETQIAHYQQTHPATQELMMQIEELRNMRTILERDLNNQQFEVSRLNNELRSMTDQLNRKNAEIEKFNCIITNMKIENEELLKENSRNNEQINLTYNEKAQLQMEYDDLKKQFMEMREKSNNSEQLQELESTAYRYRELLNEKTQELHQLQERLAQLETSNKDMQLHDAEVEEKKKTIVELNDRLHKQLEKNEDLRRKNWKAMEALSNMEKTLESKMKGIPCSSHEIKLKEREKLAEHLVKNLSNICESNVTLPHSYEDDTWFTYLDDLLREFSRHLPTEEDSQFSSSLEGYVVPKDNVPVLDELEKQNKQLQTMVSRYKRIISETEGMLNSLQNHIEQEENRWREQVHILTDQVQTMSEKVQILQTELTSLSEERNRLQDQVKNIQNGCVENDIDEQKSTSRMNKCLPLMESSSMNEVVSS